MQETQETHVQSSGGEDPLEEEMATCSNILAWKFQFSRGAWQHTVHTHTYILLSTLGYRNSRLPLGRVAGAEIRTVHVYVLSRFCCV